MKKGIGEHQLEKEKTAKSLILNLLSDGRWHRYTEIQQTTNLSTATLSKHLKNLEKEKVIEKKIDLESGDYPYPVYYRLPLSLDKIIKAYSMGASIETLRKTIIEYLKEKGESEKIKDAELFLNILEVLGREDSLTLLDMIDISDGVPKLKKIPLSLIQKTDKLIEILNVIMQYEPYRSMLEPELEKLEKILELYRKTKHSK